MRTYRSHTEYTSKITALTHKTHTQHAETLRAHSAYTGEFPHRLTQILFTHTQGDAATDIVSTAVGVLQNGILVNGQSLVDPASVLSVLANCIPGLDGSTRATPSNGTATVGIVSPGGVEVLPPETCAATYAYYVNDTANAIIIEFNLKVDQWGNEGTAWLQQYCAHVYLCARCMHACVPVGCMLVCQRVAME